MDIRVGVKVEGRETVLKILGMHCATCSLTVQRALLSVRGVRWAEASLASNEARLVASPELDYGELLKAVRRVGYDVYREAVYISVPGARPEDAAAVERAARLWGVFRASFSPATSLLYVEYNPLEVGPRDVAEALARAGFKAGEASRSEVDVDVDRKAAERDARDLASRLLPAVPITAVLMASMMFPPCLPSPSSSWPPPSSSTQAGGSSPAPTGPSGTGPPTWTPWWRWAPSPPSPTAHTPL